MQIRFTVPCLIVFKEEMKKEGKGKVERRGKGRGKRKKEGKGQRWKKELKKSSQMRFS